MQLRMRSWATSRSRVAGVYGRRLRVACFAAVGFLVLSLGLWALVALVTGKGFSTATAYQVVQLLFANVNPEETNQQVLEWVRIFAPWILPLLGTVAIVSALRVRLRFGWNAILGSQRDLVLVIGLGQKGMEMVRAELGSESSTPSSVVVIEPDEENPRIVQAQAEGAQVWIGDGRSPSDLKTAAWKRPSRIWIMTGDSRRNLLILDMVSKALGSRPASGSSKLTSAAVADAMKREPVQRVDVYALVSELQERRDAMRLATLNHDSDALWTHLFNQEEASAEWLIRKNPVRNAGGVPPRILLVGLGPLGRAILRELLLMCHYPEEQELAADRMPQVLTVDSADVKKVISDELPFLSRPITGVCPFVEWEWMQQDAQGWVFEHYRSEIRGTRAFTHVFICMGSEVRNLALAERIRGWESLLGGISPRVVPIVYDEEAADWSSLGTGDESSHRIHPFHVGSAYSAEAQKWRLTLREMAQRINHLYMLADGDNANKHDHSHVWVERLQRLSQEGDRWKQEMTKRALLSEAKDSIAKRLSDLGQAAWNGTLEDDRRSSLALARYLFNRFHDGSTGWRDTLHEPKAWDFELEARCEHRRWNAFMLVENFGRVSLESPKDYKTWEAKCDEKIDPEGVKLRKLARVNLNLMPFADLPDKFRRIDFHVVSGHEWIKKGDSALH